MHGRDENTFICKTTLQMIFKVNKKISQKKKNNTLTAHKICTSREFSIFNLCLKNFPSIATVSNAAVLKYGLSRPPNFNR